VSLDCYGHDLVTVLSLVNSELGCLLSVCPEMDHERAQERALQGRQRVDGISQWSNLIHFSIAYTLASAENYIYCFVDASHFTFH
jgi:hypothetical protein